MIVYGDSYIGIGLAESSCDISCKFSEDHPQIASTQIYGTFFMNYIHIFIQKEEERSKSIAFINFIESSAPLFFKTIIRLHRITAFENYLIRPTW